jgi:hypothetical protein
VLLNKRDRPCPDLAGGSRRRRGWCSARQGRAMAVQLAGRRQETGDRRQEAGGKWRVAVCGIPHKPF